MFKKNRLLFQNLRLNIRGAGNNNDIESDRSYNDKNQQHQHEYDLSDTHDIGHVSIGSNNNSNKQNRNNTLNRSDGELAAFDACIEACDALTASYSTLICRSKESSSVGSIKANITVKEINSQKDIEKNNNQPESNKETDSNQPESNQGTDLEADVNENPTHNDLNTSSTSVKVDAAETEEKDIKQSKFKLSECFVRVSPDGDLLFNPVPSNYQQGTNSLPPSSPPSSTISLLDDDSVDPNDVENENNSNVSTEEAGVQTKKPRKSNEKSIASDDDPYEFAHLPYSSDFDSAIIVGDDRQPDGDLIANGFSAKGWSPEAAGSAFRGSSMALNLTSEFVERILLTRKESAANVSNACNSIRHALTMDASDPNHIATMNNANAYPLSSTSRQHIIRKLISSGGNQNSQMFYDQNDAMSIMKKWETNNNATPGLGYKQLFPSLNAAIVAMERYHSVTSEADSERWRKASQIMDTNNRNKNRQEQQKSFHHHLSHIITNEDKEQDNTSSRDTIGTSCLPKIQKSTQKTINRAVKRELALQRATQLANDAENRLHTLKLEAKRKWAAVADAETLSQERIYQAIQERTEARARERERRQAEKEEDQNEQQRTLMSNGVDSSGENDIVEGQNDNGIAAQLGNDAWSPSKFSVPKPIPTQEEIWELVSQATDSFDQGSFAPTFTLPTLPGTAAATTIQNTNDSNIATEHESTLVYLTPTEQMQIEYECNVPRLRSAAKAADEAVEDAVGVLLNALSNLDTTTRSARIAVETGLLSAANSQAECLRSLVELEKASLHDRLRELENFEAKVKEIDVRSDIRHCIDKQKAYPNHINTVVREDDDGGIASALAVFNCHRETVSGMAALENQIGNVVLEGWGSADETGIVSREEIENMISILFTIDPNANEDAKSNESNTQAIDDMPRDLDSIVAFVINAVQDQTKMACIHRAMVCSALNKQRSLQTEIKYDANFDGLCKILKALLSGCDRHTDDIDNAKMCMILAQTFYKEGKDKANDESSETTENTGETISDQSIDRRTRIYVKDELKDHPIWSDEHFWDQALFQCISDALTKSGVLRSFQSLSKDETIEWHDLTQDQRIEAASQLHAVIAAQLGALAHSMVEFGCDIEGACSFVRRMSIRHQLPISKRALLLQHLVGRD